MANEPYHHQDYVRAADIIRTQITEEPKIGLILGSGLNAIADEIEQPVTLPYERIPNFPRTTIEGHPGHLVFGNLEGQSVVVMVGRSHYYEGVPLQKIGFPIRVLQILGIDILIVTNAAGGINPDFEVGDLMLIRDHIGLPSMTGLNPLRGPNDPELGPRFPDMTRAYDLPLRRLAEEIAQAKGLPLHQGVYAWVSGPSFETPAELRFLRTIGADAVGMSTVPEVIVARHGNTRVLGISGISNVAILDPSEEREASHEEVLIAGKVICPRMTTLLRGVLQHLDEVRYC